MKTNLKTAARQTDQAKAAGRALRMRGMRMPLVMEWVEERGFAVAIVPGRVKECFSASALAIW